MNKTTLKIALWIAMPLTCAALLSFTVLQQRTRSVNTPVAQSGDTVPSITAFETGRLDEALKYLDEKMKDFNDEWVNETGNRVRKQVDEAMAKMNFSNVQQQAMEAIRKTDWDKINRDIENASACISKAEIDRKVAKAMTLVKPVDKEKIRNQVNEAMRAIHFDALKIQMDDLKKQLKDQQHSVDQHLKTVLPDINDQLENTKKQLQRLKDASLQMQRDGLIDNSSTNKIQFIKGKLFINGIQQSDKISEKFKHYFIDNRNSTAKKATIIAV